MAIDETVPMPRLLGELIAKDRWNYPGKDRIRTIAPFITDPLVFLTGRAMMNFESAWLMGNDEAESRTFHEYRGSRVSGPRDLPWMDVERSLFIAVNERIGDDVGIALDYRTSSSDPRVIANEWVEAGCVWREVAPTFTEFAALLHNSAEQDAADQSATASESKPAGRKEAHPESKVRPR